MAATLAHRLARILPGSISSWARPKYHIAREVLALRRLGGTLSYENNLAAWVATRPFGPKGLPMTVALRSYRELRRFVNFGANKADLVHRWLQTIQRCDTLYDVGSANGLEGFLAHHLHGSHVVFIEPFTPSIETILKTIHILVRNGASLMKFDVVHAGCDDHESYDRLYMHGLPKAGETLNSFSQLADYCRGGRTEVPVAVSQWLKGVSLDSLHFVYHLPPPTHVKIDVDGFENRVVRGARQILQERLVRSWAIEVTGDSNEAEIAGLMAGHDYVEVGRWEHYPGTLPRTFDIIYFQRDVAAEW